KMADSEKKMAVLRSSDGLIFEVELEAITLQSQVMRNMADDMQEGREFMAGRMDVPISHASADVLAKVVEYCVHQAPVRLPQPAPVNEEDDNKAAGFAGRKRARSAPPPILSEEEKARRKKELQEQWDEEFLAELAHKRLQELMLAANHLAMPGLLRLVCKEIGRRLPRMSLEELRGFFNLEKVYTPEQEAELKRDHEWAFRPLPGHPYISPRPR
ncbi:hypothetical protein GOP47_0006823, partial [Adiantum capillus-veneris]